ncbi:MAG: deoxyribonuclease IV [Patescibacteria group bacterium]
MRRIGAHVSISGGLDKAVERIVGMGGNCMQIFSSSPQMWHNKPLIITGKIKLPVFIHAKYLINLGSANQELVEKSIASLKYDLKVGEMIGASGLIVHLGSHMGQGFGLVKKQLVSTIKTVLRDSSGRVKLLIENSAGQKGKLCSQLSEIKLLLQDIHSDKVGWCLDTCHSWGAGISFGKDMENTLIQFDLVKSLICLHVNDSKGVFGGGLDRHENIGEGKMGLKELGKYVNYPAFKNLPLITEAPGFDGGGPDRKNIEILKKLCNE